MRNLRTKNNRKNNRRNRTRTNSSFRRKTSRNNREVSRQITEIEYNKGKTTRSNTTKHTTKHTSKYSSNSGNSSNYEKVKKIIKQNKRNLEKFKKIECDVSYFGCMYPCIWEGKKIRDGKCIKISEEEYKKRHLKYVPDNLEDENLMKTKKGRQKLIEHHRKHINMINDKNKSEYEKLKSRKLEIIELLKDLAKKDKDYSYKIQQNPQNIDMLINEWGLIRDEFKNLEKEMDEIDLKLIHYKSE